VGRRILARHPPSLPPSLLAGVGGCLEGKDRMAPEREGWREGGMSVERKQEKKEGHV